jgi:hypothetical protein
MAAGEGARRRDRHRDYRSWRIERELRSLLPGRTIHNRGVTVRALSAGDSLEGIQMLYIGELRGPQLTRVLEEAQRRAILVVTDTPEGMHRGSMINFVLDERRVRFEISRAAAEQAGLKLSSRLLSVALRVHSSGLIIDPMCSPLVFAHYRKPTSMRLS